MAEVIGVVASGISIAQLAGQVTACTLKLKAYWDEVKEAPTEIKYLVREVDALSLILSQIQDGYTGGENVYLQQSLELCRDGAEELKRLVDEMEMKLSLGGGRWKRKVGAVKVALKKEEMKRLKGRLESAVRLLSLAHQSYIGTMIKMQPEIIVARLSTMNKTVHQPEEDKVVETESSENSSVVVSKQYEYWTSSRTWMQSLIGSIEYQKRRLKRMGRQTEEMSLKYQLPDWLAYQAWEVGAYRDRSAWRLNLQTYRVLPGDAPIFESVRAGDLQRVRHLLSTRESYVNDRHKDDGRTPLHVAAKCGMTEICQLLLTESADAMSYDDRNRTPFHEICESGGVLYFTQMRDPRPIIRLLVGAGSSALLIQDYDCLQNYRGPEDSFSYLLQQCFPPLDQLSLRDRLSVASSLAETWWPNAVDLIHMVLNPVKLEELARVRPPDDNLMHLCMMKYRSTSGPEDDHKKRREIFLRRLENPSDPWRTFTRELIMAGGHVSTLDSITGMSPLGELMNDNDLGVADTGKALETWLQDLKDAGVDLEEYGKRESALSQAYDTKDRWMVRYGTPMGFTSYGPDVEDWVFYAQERTDIFAGIFWKLVEKQTCLGEDSDPELDLSGMNIPGSWATFGQESD